MDGAWRRRKVRVERLDVEVAAQQESVAAGAGARQGKARRGSGSVKREGARRVGTSRDYSP